MLTTVRGCVSPGDRDLTLKLLNAPETRMFGGLLSRALPEDSDITDALLKAFTAEQGDQERSIGMFHQLTARDLEPADRRPLLEWLSKHSEAFVSEQRHFFGGPDGSQLLRGRMTSPAYAAKRWVYMFSAQALTDRDEAHALIEKYLDDPDPLLAEAARMSLEL